MSDDQGEALHKAFLALQDRGEYYRDVLGCEFRLDRGSNGYLRLCQHGDPRHVAELKAPCFSLHGIRALLFKTSVMRAHHKGRQQFAAGLPFASILFLGHLCRFHFSLASLSVLAKKFFATPKVA